VCGLALSLYPFSELPPTVLYGMPFVPLPPPAVFFSAPDLQLHTKIVNQIDYYFRYSFWLFT
jgi:la-related protein 1